MSKSIRFALFTLCVLAAAWYFHQRQVPDAVESSAHTWFLTDFRKEVNQSQRLRLEVSAEEMLELDKHGEQWVVQSLHDYPALGDKVRAFLRQLASLANAEAKTSDPQRLAALQLDPEGETKPKHVQVWAQGETPILDLWLGKQKWQPQQGVYLRRDGEEQSYYAEGSLALPYRALDWVELELLSLPATKLQSVRLQDADGHAEFLFLAPEDEKKEGEEESTAAAEWQRQGGVPEGRVWKSHPFQALRGALSWFRFDDVLPASDKQFAEAPERELTWTTVDHQVVHIRLWPDQAEGQGAWLQLEATLVEEEGAAAPESADKPQPGREEVEKWQQKWAGWAFHMPKFKADLLRQGLEDWLEPLPQEEEAEAEQEKNPE